ncbi:MAG: hypothetical protein H5T86_05140 [Armatimonadetes bacterium]|nr:hypothetical protein [Armatimonadota bacterium]
MTSFDRRLSSKFWPLAIARRRARPVSVAGALFAAALLLAAGSAAQEKEAVAAQPVAGVHWSEEEAEVPYAVAGVLKGASPNQLKATFYLAPATGDGQWVVLEIKSGTARFLTGQPGNLADAGPAGTLRLSASSDGWPFAIHRRGWRLTFICDGRVICRGWSATAQGAKEKVGWKLGEGTELADDRVQPIGPIFAADDFSRVASAEGEWEAASGKWSQRSLREDEQASAMDATKSANPFSYFGEPPGDGKPAVTTTGYWFWTSYSIEAAVRGSAQSVIGLALCYQDEGNYLAVRWTSKVATENPDRIELLGVIGGTGKVLAQARGGFLPNQWYRLRLGYCDGYLVAWVDGCERLRAATELFGQGQAALLAAGREGAFFDDIVIRDWECLADNFDSATPGKWQFVGGKWVVRGGELHVSSPQQALAIIGDPQWGDMSVEVAGRGKAAKWGVVFGADGPARALVCVEPVTRRLCVYTSGDGKSWVPMAAVAAPTLNDRVVLVAQADRGVVQATCGGASTAVFVPGVKGRVALFAENAADVAFGNFWATPVEPPPSVHLVKEFEDVQTHFEMAEWASRRHAWAPAKNVGSVPLPGSPLDNTWWSKGDYVDNYELQIPVRGVGARDIALTVVTDAEPGLIGTGVVIRVTGKQGERALTVSVSSAEKEIVSKQVSVQNENVTVSCRRSGALLVVLVDGEPAFSAEVIPPPGKAPQLEAEQKGEQQ